MATLWFCLVALMLALIFRNVTGVVAPSGEINQAIAESAVLYFVSPVRGCKRGDVGNAARAGVGRK